MKKALTLLSIYSVASSIYVIVAAWWIDSLIEQRDAAYGRRR